MQGFVRRANGILQYTYIWKGFALLTTCKCKVGRIYICMPRYLETIAIYKSMRTGDFQRRSAIWLCRNFIKKNIKSHNSNSSVPC